MSRSTTALPTLIRTTVGWSGKLWKNRSLWRCMSVGDGVRVYGKVVARGEGEIHLGAGVVLDGRDAPIELHVLRGGVLRLGQRVQVKGGTVIEAFERIEIGDESVIEEFCLVIDNQAHSILDRRGDFPPSNSISVGKRCRIGRCAKVLPGAALGDSVVLHPGVVVGRPIPAGFAVRGSPPKMSRAGGTQ